MKKFLTKEVLIGALFTMVALGNSARAEVYVSFNGGFYIEYPQEWRQVEYLTADAFLSMRSVGQPVMKYEAVFAPKNSSPFFQNEYLILAIDTMDWLYEYREDSIVAEMKENFGKDIQYFPSWDKPGNVSSDAPIYDREKRVLSVVTDVTEDDKILKKNFFVRKFYDKGIANFYFFAPDSTFEQSLVTFRQIVNSFGTDNIEQKIPKETAKIVSENGADRTINYKTMLLALGLGVLVVAAILIKMRSASKHKKNNLNQG